MVDRRLTYAEKEEMQGRFRVFKFALGSCLSLTAYLMCTVPWTEPVWIAIMIGGVLLVCFGWNALICFHLIQLLTRNYMVSTSEYREWQHKSELQVLQRWRLVGFYAFRVLYGKVK